MRRVEARIDVTDRHRLDTLVNQTLTGGDNLFIYKRPHHAAIRPHALADLKPMTARHQGFGLLPGQVEHCGRSNTPDFQNIAETRRRDQPCLCAAFLEDCIRAHRGAMHHFPHIGQ